MSILTALILGVVEGITEFLPVSSTAHLLLTQKLMGLELTQSLKTFDIAIQLGAIAAVVVVSGKRLLVDTKMIGLIVAAFIPTAVIGLFLHGLVTEVFFESTTAMLSALAIGGVVMILVEKYKKPGTKERLTWKDAVLVGIIQTLAMMPGVSRSGATIIGAMLLGVTRKEAVEFSFLIAIPTMLAATILDIGKNPGILHSETLPLLLAGGASAFITALIAIRWLRAFIQTHTFTSFGVYRILVALALFWVFA